MSPSLPTPMHVWYRYQNTVQSKWILVVVSKQYHRRFKLKKFSSFLWSFQLIPWKTEKRTFQSQKDAYILAKINILMLTYYNHQITIIQLMKRIERKRADIDKIYPYKNLCCSKHRVFIFLLFRYKFFLKNPCVQVKNTFCGKIVTCAIQTRLF